MLSSIDSAGGHHRPGRHAADRLGRVSGGRYRRHHAPLLQAQLSGEGPGELAAVIDEAFQIATTGRPGPVVIDIPKDVQIATAAFPEGPVQRRNRYNPQLAGGEAEIAQAIELIAKAKAPVFYTGGGVINSGPRASELLRELQAITKAPVTSTLMGLGAFPADHEDWLGMLGMHGTYEANWAMNQADLIICVGARFDDRVTGRLDAFAPNSTKIHIDIDRASINKTVRVDLPIIGDCATVLQQILDGWNGRKAQDLTAWKARVTEWRAKKSLSYAENPPPSRPSAPSSACSR
jgi:acetolactate synthase-1/2/3 large subunit